MTQTIPRRVGVLGIPFDGNSSWLRGAAAAPRSIREALHCPSSNLSTEGGRELGEHAGWRDLGDLELGDHPERVADQIGAAADRHLEAGLRLLSLGGDHSITHPIVRAHHQHHPGLTILQLDAHPDLYDELDGSRTSHACPFARIMEEGLATRLVQVGIRTMNAHQREQAKRFGVEVVAAGAPLEVADLKLQQPLYLSLDLDVLDPAFAPGVSHPEPGGLSTRELLHLVHSLPGPLVGADIVELNPQRDPQDLTAKVAAKLLREILDNMIGPDNINDTD